MRLYKTTNWRTWLLSYHSGPWSLCMFYSEGNFQDYQNCQTCSVRDLSIQTDGIFTLLLVSGCSVSKTADISSCKAKLVDEPWSPRSLPWWTSVSVPCTCSIFVVSCISAEVIVTFIASMNDQAVCGWNRCLCVRFILQKSWLSTFSSCVSCSKDAVFVLLAAVYE